jgi:PIN domain nuclease of toxin-antitoxin system
MIAGVADTHAALWYLLADPRLSASAKLTIDAAASSRNNVALWAISLAEIF